MFCSVFKAVMAVLGLVLAAPLVAESAVVPVGKLPDQAVPLAYRIDLTVDPAQPRFSGKVEIDLVLKAASASMFLHGRDLAVSAVSATAAGKTVAAKWQQESADGTGTLTFATPLPAGTVKLSFAYDAPFGDNPSGLYRVKVGEDWYAWSQLQSIDARAVFPSIDEPGYKVPFTVTLRTPPGQMAVSNAPELSVTREGGLDVHRFAPTLPLPTYLVAVVAGPFVALSGEVAPTPQRQHPLPLRIVSTKNNAGRLAYALQGSKEIVAHLEDYFGDAFPYPKLDQITSPIMPGAMENAGADIYGDSLLVMDEASPVAQKRRFGMVVSHELGHQWFGDLVTPAWWDDIWLNESFANWMGFRIGNVWKPELNIGAGAVGEGLAAMDTDALIAGRPIRNDITANNQIDEAFDSITYGKGGHVVAMVAGFMGDDKFKAGVRRYMAAHRFGNATSKDFFGALAEQAGDARLLPAMQGFISQQGVPLLTFSGGEGGQYRVTQSRYAALGTTAPDTRWAVPMCVRQGETRTCQLLESATSINLNGAGAIMPNAGGTGYYRFELPKADWDALIATAERLPGNEALALADSLGASFAAGRSSAEQLMALAQGLSRNPDSYANGAAFGALAELVDAGFADDKAKVSWRKFVSKLARRDFQRLGFDPRAGAYAGQEPERIQARVRAVNRMAGVARDTKLRKQLVSAATAYLGGDKNALDPVWFPMAFDGYVATGGIAAAKSLADAAMASEDGVFRPAALEAVASSGKEAIARWMLDEWNDTRLRVSEKRALLRGVISASKTRDFGYQRLVRDVPGMLSGGAGIFFARRLPQWLTDFCSVDSADDFARTLRPLFAGKTGALELERTIERVRNCGVLQAARKDEVSRALRGR